MYEGLSHIGERAQAYADSLTGLLHVYLNMSSNQTGEVVKLLTMITVITTPLMIVGTWYGMNFKHMPELEMRYGYELAIVLMLGSTAVTWRATSARGSAYRPGPDPTSSTVSSGRTSETSPRVRASVFGSAAWRR